MDMQASRELGVTQQQAWDALNDPEVLKLCIPGCDKVEATGENQYAISMGLRIGPVSAKFAGKINLSDIVSPQSYTISFEGQGGAAGFGKGNAQVTLTPTTNGAAGCTLGYVVHASVGGKVAQLGQRLIDGAAKSMAEDFFKRFDLEMQKRYPQVALPDAPKSIAVPASGASAGTPSDAQGLPVWMWAAGAAVLVVLGMALSR